MVEWRLEEARGRENQPLTISGKHLKACTRPVAKRPMSARYPTRRLTNQQVEQDDLQIDCCVIAFDHRVNKHVSLRTAEAEFKPSPPRRPLCLRPDGTVGIARSPKQRPQSARPSTAHDLVQLNRAQSSRLKPAPVFAPDSAPAPTAKQVTWVGNVCSQQPTRRRIFLDLLPPGVIKEIASNVPQRRKILKRSCQAVLQALTLPAQTDLSPSRLVAAPTKLPNLQDVKESISYTLATPDPVPPTPRSKEKSAQIPDWLIRELESFGDLEIVKAVKAPAQGDHKTVIRAVCMLLGCSSAAPKAKVNLKDSRPQTARNHRQPFARLPKSKPLFSQKPPKQSKGSRRPKTAGKKRLHTKLEHPRCQKELMKQLHEATARVTCEASAEMNNENNEHVPVEIVSKLWPRDKPKSPPHSEAVPSIQHSEQVSLLTHTVL